MIQETIGFQWGRTIGQTASQVDAVCDLHSIAPDQLSLIPAAGGAESAQLLRGVITLESTLMCLIDAKKILPAMAIPADAVPSAQDLAAL